MEETVTECPFWYSNNKLEESLDFLSIDLENLQEAFGTPFNSSSTEETSSSSSPYSSTSDFSPSLLDFPPEQTFGSETFQTSLSTFYDQNYVSSLQTFPIPSDNTFSLSNIQNAIHLTLNPDPNPIIATQTLDDIKTYPVPTYTPNHLDAISALSDHETTIKKPPRKRSRNSQTTTTPIRQPQSSDISFVSLDRETLLRISSKELEDRTKELTQIRSLTTAELREIKRQRRLVKNREYAQASRVKKKAHVAELRQHAEGLVTENQRLREKLEVLGHRVRELEEENLSLKSRIFGSRSLQDVPVKAASLCVLAVLFCFSLALGPGREASRFRSQNEVEENFEFSTFRRVFEVRDGRAGLWDAPRQNVGKSFGDSDDFWKFYYCDAFGGLEMRSSNRTVY
eukprot:TRINITY_DN4711_c0_g1_i1.p1 TRINITY_DN4711_c0_g1~~TRINITY_DN4711_c0_g1_i1.p1  ORF type:complete len:398 (-),score=71.06 TRINITY_DN4711_c0_g1_i1:160-1353(-)